MNGVTVHLNGSKSLMSVADKNHGVVIVVIVVIKKEAFKRKC